MTFSATWDELTTSADLVGRPAFLTLEKPDAPNRRLTARTADPRLNPDAVRSTSSSTRYRRALNDSAIAANINQASSAASSYEGNWTPASRWTGRPDQ